MKKQTRKIPLIKRIPEIEDEADGMIKELIETAEKLRDRLAKAEKENERLKERLRKIYGEAMEAAFPEEHKRLARQELISRKEN